VKHISECNYDSEEGAIKKRESSEEALRLDQEVELELRGK